MLVNGSHYRTIWVDPESTDRIQVIDQRSLPHEFCIETLETVDDVITAIADMHVRGAGLIGAAAGYGMYLAAREAQQYLYFDAQLEKRAQQLKKSRPTAVNLAWAVDQQIEATYDAHSLDEKIYRIFKNAQAIADQDAERCKQIGEHGLQLIRDIYEKNGHEPVNILTHCNAGWLAFVDYGSATAPLYAAHDEKIPIHVWVDETRPRNQGARLTAWELGQHGVRHTIIADNVGGHLMQHDMVDLVIVGSDRTTYTGDVANKIGTYLKALAAYDTGIPFYAALPSSTFDWTIADGVNDIPIEERGSEEVKYIQGKGSDGISKILLTPEESPSANYAFDVTPSRLVTGLITERGICEANEKSIQMMFPEYYDG